MPNRRPLSLSLAPYPITLLPLGSGLCSLLPVPPLDGMQACTHANTMCSFQSASCGCAQARRPGAARNTGDDGNWEAYVSNRRP